VALDKVFGYKNFQSEIIWTYKRWSNSKIGLLNSHQVIFFYSKSKDFKFRQKYEDYSPSTNLDQIFQERQKNKNGKTVYKKNKDGKAVLNQNKKGVPLGDVWDIPYLNPKAKERVGYPTQKPILLLERIIELVTDEKDLVLDPFCGSGTTLVASKILNRKYLGFDKSQEAVNLSKERLLKPIKTESKLLKKGRKSYFNQNPKILEILKKIGAVPVQRNKGIDGFLTENGKILPVPIKIQRENEDLQVAKINLLNACKNQNYANSILFTVKDEKETGLFTKNSQ
jgi:site-specific DNA-methyltransferase (adenine-specific)